MAESSSGSSRSGGRSGDSPPRTIAEAHRRASEAFRALSPEEQRKRMEEAGVFREIEPSCLNAARVAHYVSEYTTESRLCTTACGQKRPVSTCETALDFVTCSDCLRVVGDNK